jgi:hypothetical protein
MSQTHDDIRALRLMVDELRAEPAPDRPWDDIEARLWALIDDTPRSSVGGARAEEAQAVARGDDARQHGAHPHAPGLTPAAARAAGCPAPRSWMDRGFSRVIGLAVAAAALALGVSATTAGSRMPATAAPERHLVDPTTIALAGAGGYDLAALRVGDVVEAGEAPLRFAEAGLVTWTLAPGSSARVISKGIGHTVALERGSIRAEVTPRDPSEGLVEAFAVEVDQTRVAVHGTAFSVSREGARVVVDVEHGAVAVGPVGHVGATTGHLLVGPSRASFSLDGGRTAQLLDPSAGVASSDAVALHAAPAQVEAASHPTAPVTSDAVERHEGSEGRGAAAGRRPTGQALAAHMHPAAEHPATLAPAQEEPPRLTADVVRARLDRCFKQTQTSRSVDGASSVHIDPITVTLLLDILPDGTVRSARFDRQIKPELVTCAGPAISGRFPDGTGHLEIPVTFQP